MLFSWSQNEHVQLPCQGVKNGKLLPDINQSTKQFIHPEIPRNSWIIVSVQPQFSSLMIYSPPPPSSAEVGNSPWACSENAHSDSDDKEKPPGNEAGKTVRSWSRKAVNAITRAFDQTCISERSRELEGDEIESEPGG